MNDNSNDFKLDDPVRISGPVTPEKAAAIIDRLNSELDAEREANRKHWQPYDPYLGMK